MEENTSLTAAMTAPNARNTNRIAQKAVWVLHVPITARLALSGFATWSFNHPIVLNAWSIPAKSWKNSSRIWQVMGLVTGR